jgi:hypothetical protein
MRRLGALLLATSGCGPLVHVEDEGDTEGEDSASSTSETGSPASEPDPAPRPERVLSAFFVDEGAEISLSFSTYLGAACPDAMPSAECAPFAQWSLRLVLPSPVAPGEYPLSELSGHASFADAEDPGTGVCARGFGTALGSGVLVIDAADATLVEGSLVDVSALSVPDPTTEEFSAPACLP